VKLRTLAISVGRVAVDVAPVVALLSRTSHPLAWAAAGLHVAKHAYTEWITSKPRAWTHLSWRQVYAILALARATGIGDIVGRYDGGEERRIGGTLYGAGPAWHVGPYGDSLPIVDALWAAHGSLALYTDDAEDLVLAPDPREPSEPAAAVRALAEDQAALRATGGRVGLLLDGPPGSGKSEALLHVATVLGGRVLRVSLATCSPTDAVALASALAASVVVLDDIDRTETSLALDAIGVLVRRGVAVLASSNDKAEICEAMLRDMRIDDHRTLGVVEPDVLERMAAGLEPEVVERLRACTVATVARYLERRAAWGPERALARLRPLVRPE
jgi:hypothetical protein